MATGVFPGTFNPLTVAHLSIAESVTAGLALDRLDLAVSRSPLGKRDLVRPRLEDRLHVLADACASRPQLGVLVTDDQLVADIAAGYDVLVLGRDKWEQVLDSSWYASAAARDECLLRLPDVVVIPRGGDSVSSTAVRRGRTEWMAPEALAFDARTGAWTDPDRYERWVSASPAVGATITPAGGSAPAGG